MSDSRTKSEDLQPTDVEREMVEEQEEMMRVSRELEQMEEQERELREMKPEETPELDLYSHRAFKRRGLKHRKVLTLSGSSDNRYCVPEGYHVPDPNFPIGKGSYGMVHRLCKGSQCDFVLKSSLVLDSPETAARDLYFLSWLDRYAHPRISPRLYESSRCLSKRLWRNVQKEGTIELKGFEQKYTHAGLVMDRWDMDLDSLAVNTAHELDIESVFPRVLTERQLLQAFAIAAELDRYGICHGDLALRQYLYNVRLDRLALTDYGFAGQIHSKAAAALLPVSHLNPVPLPFLPIMGWPVMNTGPKSAQCGTAAEQNSPQIINRKHFAAKHGLVPFLNLWMLDLELTMFGPVGVLLDDKVQEYAGIRETLMPMEVQRMMSEHCAGVGEIVRIREKKRLYQTTDPGYTVSKTSIITGVGYLME